MDTRKSKVLKILNIVENLDRGAVENWLVNVFLTSREMRPDWEWTFYCILNKPGRLDEKVRAAGGRIIYTPVSISNKLKFLQELRKELKRGNYDIIHSHHDYLSGFYLLASQGIHFKKRLLQVHNTDKALPVGSNLLRQMLLKPFRLSSFYYSDEIIGISHDTLLQYAKKNRTARPKTRVLYYGIDLEPFSKNSDPQSAYASLNLPVNAKKLLFVGRMNEFKNPLFVVEILRSLLQKRKDVYAIFIGEGDLKNEVKTKSEECGIENYVRVLGWSDQTAALMKGADVFVFPRLEIQREGLGLVVVEAQAAGLPMVISHAIVKDAIVIDELTHYVNLNNNPDEWAAEVEKIIDAQPPISKAEALKRMQDSPFYLCRATKNLISIYESNEAG